MGYGNIIDSLSDRRIDEGMLNTASSGSAKKVKDFLSDIAKGNFSGMTLRDGSFRSGRIKKIYKAKELNRVKKGDAIFIDYGDGILGILFEKLDIPRIMYYKIKDVPFDEAVNTLVKEYGTTYTNYLSDAKTPKAMIFNALADVMYNYSKKAGCADEKESFDIFFDKWKGMSGTVNIFKKYLIDSNLSTMIELDKPILRILYGHDKDSYSMYTTFKVSDYDALKSFVDSNKNSLGGYISQSLYGRDEYILSLYLYAIKAKDASTWHGGDNW